MLPVAVDDENGGGFAAASATSRAEPPAIAASVPHLARWTHRTLLGGILAAYFFVAFCAFRGLIGGWGLPLVVALPAALATLIMVTFVVWLAPLMDLPEMWFLHRRPARRAARGLCPACGYDLSAVASSRTGPATAVCPECGTGAAAIPASWQLSGATFRRFFVLLGSAYIAGCLAGAVWITLDESAFVREQPRHGSPYQRQRAWPAEFAWLHYDDEKGFHSTTVLESEPIAGWKPRR